MSDLSPVVEGAITDAVTTAATADAVTTATHVGEDLGTPKEVTARWAKIITEDLGHAVEGIIGAGRHLQEAKDELPHGDFGPLLKQLKMHERTAQRLMAIASNEALANPTHASHLPASWMTLYELSRLPPKLLEAKIVAGVITPELERKGVVSLKNELAAHGRPHPEQVDAPETVAAKRVAVAPAETLRELEAAREHIAELEAAREIAPSPEIGDEEKHALIRENLALKSEVEELKAERNRLRSEDLVERALALAAEMNLGQRAEFFAAIQSRFLTTLTAPKRPRGRPKGSKSRGKS
jgi:hypothetical protein